MSSQGSGRSKALFIISFALWVFFLSTGVSAQQYKVTAINPPQGYTASRAMGINNLGEVVGSFFNIDTATGDALGRQAFVWDSANGAWLLPSLSGESSAWAINDNGFATGYSYNKTTAQRAVMWDTQNLTVQDLGALTNETTGQTGEASTTYGINNHEEVVGSADIPNDAGTFTPFHAFIYDATNGIWDLGTLNTTMPEWEHGYSIAYDVNNNGQVVGIAHDSPWAAFIYDDTNGMRMLQKDSGYAEGEWYAVVINDSGLIGGHVIAGENQSIPFYWPNESSAPVKITMPAGFPYGEIYGINAHGEMVGMMWSSDQGDATEHAFIFDIQNGVRDLNDLIDPASGWVLNFGRDINDSTQVAGYGELNGEKRAFVLGINPPPAPVLVSPANGSSQSGTSVTFTWNAAPGASDYRLYVRDASGIVLFSRWLGNVTTHTVTKLPGDGGLLYWRVIARNVLGNGPWSEQWTLNGAAENKPPAPVLVSPASGTNQAGTSVTFAWNAAPGAYDYRLYVKDASGELLFSQWLGDVTGYTVTGLPNDGRLLYWAVIARNAAGNSPWSEQWTLNGAAEEKPPAPVLVSPANGSSQSGTSATFIWNAASGAYDYRLDVKDASGNVVLSQWLGDVTSFTVTWLPGDGRLLYWRVIARNAVGTGLWSEQWTLNSQAEAIPPAPVLVSPTKGTTQDGSSVTFTWNAAPGAYDYRLYVKNASGEFLFNGWLGDVTNYTVTSLPDDGSTLYWAVYARNTAGRSPRSQQWTFTNGSGS